MRASEEDAEQVAEWINELSMQFTKLCAERHAAGAEEYGEITFLHNDVVRMMLEELADVSNYVRMHAVKLLMLQQMLETEMTEKGIFKDEDIEVDLGFKAFKGTKDVGWTKQ